MRKLLVVVCTAIACAIPAVASGANDPASNAAKFCKQLATASGGKASANYAAAVRTMSGNSKVNDSNAYGKCVSWKTRQNRHNNAQAQRHAKSSARTDCTAERNDPNFAGSHNGQTFAQAYGANNDNSAYGRCVSQKTKQNVQQSQQAQQAQDQNTVSAAKTCKRQFSSERAAFNTQWGTRRNAFGKCVSSTAKHHGQQQGA